MKVVLASGSPRRRELLTEILEGGAFEIRVSDVDETVHDGEHPVAAAERLALKKARAVHDLCPEATIIAADTIVFLEGSEDCRMFGKPADEPAAVEMLKALSGRTHRVVTGYTILSGPSAWTGSVITNVTFRDLNEPEILDYVSGGEPMDKAGSYGLQGQASSFVTRVDGSRSNVIGLPLDEVRKVLSEAKVLERRERAAQ